MQPLPPPRRRRKKRSEPTQSARMASPTTLALEDEADWAVDLPSEVWALVAAHRGVVGTRQLMRVCRTSHAGGMEYLSTLPGFVVVCSEQGASLYTEETSGVWRLDLATMRWEPMPAHKQTIRELLVCCAVRGNLLVIGGTIPQSTQKRLVSTLSL